jgi:hypothetical protein
LRGFACDVCFPLQPLGFEVTDDPQTGKRTRVVTQFSNRALYAGSFQPPEGYEIAKQEMHEIPCQ